MHALDLSDGIVRSVSNSSRVNKKLMRYRIAKNAISVHNP